MLKFFKNLNTKNLPVETWKLKIALDDGTTKEVKISFQYGFKTKLDTQEVMRVC